MVTTSGAAEVRIWTSDVLGFRAGLYPHLAERQRRLWVRAEARELVAGDVRGDPQSPLRWTTKSLCVLAKSFQCKGFQVSTGNASDELKDSGYSLQHVQVRHTAWIPGNAGRPGVRPFSSLIIGSGSGACTR